jgi:membrane protein YdbS with pleckstrin-like domain
MSQPPPTSAPDGGNAPTSPMGGDTTAPLRPRRRRGAPAAGPPIWQGQPAMLAPAPRGPRVLGPAFRGQQPNETTLFVVRKHWIFLLLPGLPALLTLSALAALLLIHTTNLRLGALYFLIEVLLGLVGLLFLLKWLVADLSNWVFDIYVLTTRRIVEAKGFFNPDRLEAPLDRIQQMQVMRDNLFQYLINYGNVELTTAGAQGTFNLERVARPTEIADRIREAARQYGGGPKAPPTPIEPHDPALRQALDDVAPPVVVTPPHGIPQRTFGGLLHRPADVRLLPGEAVLDYIYRHWFVLVRREIPPALVVLVSLAVTAFGALLRGPWWLLGALGLLAGVIYGGLVYLNYADDVFILTSQRIIDIDRFVFFFFEGRKQAEYGRVQNAQVKVESLVGRVLNYGNLMVETAGRLPNIEMSDIPNPFVVQDKIFGYISAAKERDAVATLNRQRQDQRKLLAAAFNAVLIEVPDLRRLGYVEALAAAQGAGLRLQVQGERRAPGVPPGLVLEQVPGPGATALHDGEVHVILSGRT